MIAVRISVVKIINQGFKFGCHKCRMFVSEETCGTCIPNQRSVFIVFPKIRERFLGKIIIRTEIFIPAIMDSYNNRNRNFPIVSKLSRNIVQFPCHCRERKHRVEQILTIMDINDRKTAGYS